MAARTVSSDVDAEVFGPWQSFKTEPHFKAALVNRTVAPGVSDRLSKDHFIFSVRTFSQYGPWGPQIFDHNLDLIYYSEPNVTNPALAIQDPYVLPDIPTGIVVPMQASGGPRGPFIVASDALTRLRGHLEVLPRIYDSSYQEVVAFDAQAFGRASPLGIADGHEARILAQEGVLLSTIYPLKTDLGGVSGLWGYDACFREVDLQTKQVNFEWCFFDHSDPSESVRSEHLNRTTSSEHPADLGHINSVDRNSEGDYLVSIKYFSQVVKIAGRFREDILSGTILWRLGGRRPTIDLAEIDALAYQHHARYLNATSDAKGSRQYGESVETISVFDNGCAADAGGCYRPSAGKIIEITTTKGHSTARVIRTYEHPNKLSSKAGGSFGILSNGNVWTSYGRITEGTEFAFETSKPLQHIRFGPSNRTLTYRITRARWDGNPVWKPKVVIESNHCEPSASTTDERIDIWVSWNGASNVRKWRISCASQSYPDAWTVLATHSRTGFETHIVISSPVAQHPLDFHPTYLRLQALDLDGHSLPNGEIVQAVCHTDMAGVAVSTIDSTRRTGHAHHNTSMTIMPMLFLLILVIYTGRRLLRHSSGQ